MPEPKPAKPKRKASSPKVAKKEATKATEKPRARRKMAPRSVLTPEIKQEIIDATRKGSTREASAAQVGVSRATLFAALAAGRDKPDGPHGDFARQVDAAEREWKIAKGAAGLRRRNQGPEVSRSAHFGRVLRASPGADFAEVADLVAAAAGSPSAAADLQERAIQACREHLLPFAVHTYHGNWPYYRVSWHARLLATLFEYLATGQLRRLLVSLPPRHGKTELMRSMSAWILGRDPDSRIIGGAYSERLAVKSSKAVRRIVGHEEFREVFPDVVLPDRREVMAGEFTVQGREWELAGGARGGYYASGLEGSVTGSGGGYILVDDPCKNRQEAESPVYQQNVLSHYLDDWTSRSEQPDCRLVMATRWGDMDLIGQLITLAQGDITADQWHTVNIPAILETDADRYPGDPREIGQPLWPGLYLLPDERERDLMPEELIIPPPPPLPSTAVSASSRTAVERALSDLRQKIKNTMGGEALYQGQPRSREGGLIKEEWCKRRWTKMPTAPGEWLLSADTKGNANENRWSSYTVYQVWYRPTGSADCYLIDERRGRWGVDIAISKWEDLCEMYPQATKKLIEYKGYGVAMYDLLHGRITGMIKVLPKADKATRAEVIAPLWSAGNVVLPDISVRGWINEWVREVTRCTGKKGEVGDRLDVMSQALDGWRAVAVPFRYSGGGQRVSAGFR